MATARAVGRGGRLPESWDNPSVMRTSSPAPPAQSAAIRHNWLRNLLLRAVEAEVPWLVALQRFRTPLLDVAMTRASFLGTHTFFMLGLPLLFFGDFSNLPGTDAELAARRALAERMRLFGRTMVFLLAEGVYLTGAVKDYLMLPRPPSPPIVRLSTHKLAEANPGKPVASIDTTTHLEYGFPSTHSADALAISAASVVFVYSYFAPFLAPLVRDALWVLLVGQYLLVAVSRLYCGMHTACDVLGGTAIGIAMVFSWLGMGGMAAFESLLGTEHWLVPLAIPLLLGILPLYVFPLKATCPCFDDCVCFNFALVGVALGGFFGRGVGLSVEVQPGAPLTLGIPAAELVLRFVARTALGLGSIVLWRLVMKSVGHAVFPPLLGKRLGTIRAKGTPEQVTRSFVYTGIGLIATYFAPRVFNTVGL
ncbi:hypothetical protein DFJ74DRAFT_678289 [Hyaloraphidium curvatum]|nr:hypothetical protein DFJ74DRAFT_678289 [Hyaloraphidium curvatum]